MLDLCAGNEPPSDLAILIYKRIEVGSKSLGINSRCGRGRRNDHVPMNKPSSRHLPQFRHRCAVADNGQMLTGFYLTQDGRDIVAKLTFGNRAHCQSG